MTNSLKLPVGGSDDKDALAELLEAGVTAHVLEKASPLVRVRIRAWVRSRLGFELEFGLGPGLRFDREARQCEHW